MKEKRKDTYLLKSSISLRRFFQPLAVAWACFVFACLFIIMGSMNLKRIDETLIAFMENKGVTIIRNFQRVAEGYFQQLTQTQQAFFDPKIGTSVTQETFSVQELFLIELTALAEKIDVEWETDHLGHDQLLSLTNKESLWLIAFLDEKGNIIFRNRPIPKGVLVSANPVIRGYEGFKINVFTRSNDTEGLGFVALRRKSGKGTIIICLNKEGFRSRSLSFSIQKAIEEISQDSDIAYLIMTDEQGKILGLSGTFSESRKKEFQTEDFSPVSNRVTTRKIILEGNNLLEVEAPVLIDQCTGAIKLGLRTDVASGILNKNRNSIIISVLFMVFITLFSMWLLYKNQTSTM
jgi:hypothetical protein